MARFRGTVQGNRSEASRLGHKRDGLEVSANGWNSGITVYASVDEHDRDVFEVYRTGGSNAAFSPKLIATVIGDSVALKGE